MTPRTGLLVPAALAVLFVVPTVARQDGPAASLEESLRRTLLALESLAGLGERIQKGELEAVPQLTAATEPPLGGDEESGPVLAQLRGEVAALEIELDALHAAHGQGSAAAPAVQGGGGETALAATTGLDDATRSLLGALHASEPQSGQPASGGRGQAALAEGGGEPSRKRSFEASGYTADALKLARAFYRQGRWDRALALLEGRPPNPAESYWRARCLEKLGRLDEAVAVYEVLVADPQGGADAQRAREDLEFLRWRRQFEERRKAASGGAQS